MEVSEVLAKAWASVTQSGVPPEIQEAAFKAAVQLIAPSSSKQENTRTRVNPAPDPGAETPATGDAEEEAPATQVDVDVYFKLLATESGIDEAALVEVFYFDADGTPHINVPGRKLGSSMTKKVQSIATGLAGVRYYVFDQPSIGVEIVRSEANAKSAYDMNNFGSHISSVPGTTVSGTGASRVLRVKGNEIEAAFRAMVNAARGVSN